tara:strand:- start:3213 stop:3371 length:159 start_codon:yes stop_codon:yes gene_type:complete
MIETKMVKYFLKNTPQSEIVADFKDIANGSYTVAMLRKDIIDTWNVKESIDG